MAEEMEGLKDRHDGESSQELSPSVVYIEAYENYQKQSYRNRCRFLAADGPQALSIPVIHDNGTYKLPISEIRIDYSKPWLQQHKRAIISAYRTSAYFEYYQDELFAILDSRPEHLIDLNMAVTCFIIDKTGLKIDLRKTEGYCRDLTGPDIPEELRGCEDLRETIHPKRPDRILERYGLKKEYFQVFSPTHGFKENLSAMDLLFNEGPDSILFLKNIRSA